MLGCLISNTTHIRANNHWILLYKHVCIYAYGSYVCMCVTFVYFLLINSLYLFCFLIQSCSTLVFNLQLKQKRVETSGNENKIEILLIVLFTMKVFCSISIKGVCIYIKRGDGGTLQGQTISCGIIILFFFFYK